VSFEQHGHVEIEDSEGAVGQHEPVLEYTGPVLVQQNRVRSLGVTTVRVADVRRSKGDAQRATSPNIPAAQTRRR
jgi:hypothetical protein